MSYHKPWVRRTFNGTYNYIHINIRTCTLNSEEERRIERERIGVIVSNYHLVYLTVLATTRIELKNKKDRERERERA